MPKRKSWIQRTGRLSVLLAASLGSLVAQAPDCAVERLDPSLPLRDGVVGEWVGDWRFQCSGFGAAPVQVIVYLDVPFANDVANLNGRDVTDAVIFVEGVTADNAVFQIPGDPPNPNANVFFTELVPQGNIFRLQANGLPGNVPLIISGVRGDMTEPGLAAPTTSDFAASMSAGGRGNFDQVPVPVVEAFRNLPIVARRSQREFLLRLRESTAAELRSAEDPKPRGPQIVRESSQRPPLTDDLLISRLDGGTLFYFAFEAAFAGTTRILAQVRAAEEYDSYRFRVMEDLEISPELPEDAEAVVLELAEGSDPNVVDEVGLEVTVGCTEPTTFNGSLTVRVAIGPPTQETAQQLFPLASFSPDCCTELPRIGAEVITETFDFVDVPCVPGGPPQVTSSLFGAADFRQSAAGGLATVVGEALAVTTAVAESIGLTELAGSEVVFFSGETVPLRVGQGAGVPAPLLFVSPTQINFQVPWEVDAGSGPVTLAVRSGGVESAPVPVELSAFAPSLFTFDFGPGRAVAIHSTDGVLAHAPESLADLGLPGRRARAGDVLLLLGTGFGPTIPPGVTGDDSLDASGAFVRRDLATTPRVLIGGVESTVFFAGLSPQFMGVNQLNVEVPVGVVPSDETSLVVVQGGVQSRDDVSIAVGP